MSFTITITGANAAEAIAELIHAASFYQKNPEIAAAETKPKKPRTAAAPAEVPSTPEPVTPPAPTATETTAATEAAAPHEPAAPPVDYEKLRTEVRAVLAPKMKDAAVAAKVSELIKSFGVSKLTEIPNEHLESALTKAKEL